MIGRTRQGAIATPHRLATEAGTRAFENGGSAVDAAIAAAAVLAVVYPHNTTVGGDSVSLVATPDGSVRCVNSTGPAAASVDVDRLRQRHGDRMPVHGPEVVTVPGAVRGWEVLRTFGSRLSWAEHLLDAERLAREGVTVAPSLARTLEKSYAAELDGTGVGDLFFPAGTPLATGDMLRQEALADSLATLSRQGAAALYGGEVGERLVAGLRGLGADLSLSDLSQFEPEVTDPIGVAFHGREVLTSPPNTQGVLLLRALAALPRSAPVDWALRGGAADLAILFGEGNELRERYIADPRFVDVPLEALMKTGLARTGRPAPEIDDVLIPKGDTVGIAAMDSDGYAVSLIQSVYHLLGSRILERDTGILMQNRGTSFSLAETSPNVLVPGKRPSHTLMPVLVTRDGRVEWVNATMGGKAQPQIHTELILHEMARASAAQAVEAPRFLVGGILGGHGADTVFLESDLPARARESLERRGIPVVELPPHDEALGQANVTRLLPSGELDAASDPRADGSAWVGPLREGGWPLDTLDLD